MESMFSSNLFGYARYSNGIRNRFSGEVTSGNAGGIWNEKTSPEKITQLI